MLTARITRALRFPALALPALLALAAPAAAWPPWISIEYPARLYPWDPAGALLVVHAHHRPGTTVVVSARAEGLSGGARRTVALTVRATDRPDTYAVEGSLARGVAWVISCTLEDPATGARASALVGLAADGRLAQLQLPVRTEGGQRLPRAATATEVEALLRSVAALPPPAAGEAAAPGAGQPRS